MNALRVGNRIATVLKRSIRTRIWLSVVLCVVAVGVVAVSSYRITEKTAALPRVLFEKPYAVGIAVHDLRADVAVMHSELAALARSPSRLGLRRFKRRMREIDLRAAELRTIISERFVGDKELVARAFAAHDAWNHVREEVVTAIRDGDHVKAYTLTKTEGYNQVKYLEESLDRLVASSNQHSRQLYEDAGNYLSVARLQGIGAVLVALLFLGSAAVLVNAIIVRPVREISEAMREIADGDLNTIIPHDDRVDEIGLIARSSKIFLNHAISIRKRSTDLLTGLPKRPQLVEHISNTQQNSEEDEQQVFLLHIDLNGFVEMNDVLGRDVGDHVLIHVAELLRSIRQPGDFLAREGADSFVLYRKRNFLGERRFGCC